MVLAVLLASVMSAGWSDQPKRTRGRSIPDAAKVQTQRGTADRFSTPIGFFHFREHEKLNPAYVGPVYVRTAIDWSRFEPQPGRFVWDGENKQAQDIDRLLADGRKVIPSIAPNRRGR